MSALPSPPDAAADWIAVGPEPPPLDRAVDWATTPRCGAVVTFLGVVRDHAEGREGVHTITYEAYEEHATRAMAEVAREARRRWPAMARCALLHRVGDVARGETSVLVVVSAPHRVDAFEAARFCIDTIKETVPVWKQEHWANGSDWGVDAAPIRSVTAGEA